MYSGIVNGQPTTFGTSGLLYRSNKVMYDRATRTLWHQFTGAPIIGPLAGAGIRQPLYPAVVSTWAEWRAAHPDTTVLSRDTGVYPAEFYVPEHDPGAIYYAYFNDPEVMFPVWVRDPQLAPKSVVIGVAIGTAAKAYPVSELQKTRVVNDTVGETDLVIVASGTSRAARVYQRGGLNFTAGPDAGDGDSGGAPATLRDDAGAVWNVTEAALVKADDASATRPRIASRTAFWFGWYQYHPHTELFQPGQ